MGIRFRILSGPLKGHFAAIKNGVIIGRAKGTLQLDDAKVSSKHAIVEEGPPGLFVLNDMGSTNGMKLGGKRVNSIPLKPGVEFSIGKTRIRVEAAATQEKASGKSAAESTKTMAPGLDPNDMEPTQPKVPVGDEAPPLPPPSIENTNTGIQEVAIAPQHWSEYFSDFCEENKGRFKDRPVTMLPFDQILQLECVRGLQLDYKWTMGYGPRKIGAASLDFPLYDTDAPDEAFTVEPSDAGPLLKTKHKDLIRVNGKPVSSEVLSPGDLIQVGETVFRVSLEE